jgi:hypothetical protein
MGLNWCRNSWQRIGVGRAVLKIGLGWVWSGEERSVLW